VDSGRWKQRDTAIHFPPSWIRRVLEMVAQGKVSLMTPLPEDRPRRGRQPPRGSGLIDRAQGGRE
jgi:hypothetical protein